VPGLPPTASPLLLVHNLVIRLNDVLVRRRAGARLRRLDVRLLAHAAHVRARAGTRGLTGRGLRLVELLAGGAERLHELLLRAVQLAEVVLLERGLRPLERLVDALLRVLADLVAPVRGVLLDLVDQRVELVARLDLLLPLAV